jgi:hypothetical protein
MHCTFVILMSLTYNESRFDFLHTSRSHVYLHLEFYFIKKTFKCRMDHSCSLENRKLESRPAHNSKARHSASIIASIMQARPKKNTNMAFNEERED